MTAHRLFVCLSASSAMERKRFLGLIMERLWVGVRGGIAIWRVFKYCVYCAFAAGLKKRRQHGRKRLCKSMRATS